MKCVVLFHRLGPYHHARLKTFASKCSLSVVEFSTVDETYTWDIVREQNGYVVTPLFTDADIVTKSVNIVAKEIRSVLNKIEPDVVAIPGWSAPASLAALSWCCETNTPTVLMADSTEHDEPRSCWKEWIKSRIVRLFSSALVGGSAHADYVTQLGLARGNIFTGYDVVDNLHFQIGSDDAKRNVDSLRKSFALPESYFLASNRFIKKKNLTRLIEAYAAYLHLNPKDSWDLVLLGDGELRQTVLSCIHSLGISERVHLPGFKQYKELPIYYGLAKVFIHASTTEQWGLVVNEAMASGMPVLVSERCGCAPDLVTNGVNGFTFDPYNVIGIAKLMLYVSSAECDLESMGNASREMIRAWSPELFGENLKEAARIACSDQMTEIVLFDKALLWAMMRR